MSTIFEEYLTPSSINLDNFKKLISNTKKLGYSITNTTDFINFLKEIDIETFIKVDNSIPFELTPEQINLLKNIIDNDVSICLCGKGSGKTTLVALLFRFMILKRLLNKDFGNHNRIDYANMCSTANSAKKGFFREFRIQMNKSLIFGVSNTLWKIRTIDVAFADEQLIMHSLNSQTSSFEGKNLEAVVVDEISEPSFTNSLRVFEDSMGSVFTRFSEGKVIAITWTRYPTANPLSDAGYYLYDKYSKLKESSENKTKIYTTIKTTKDMRGSFPKDYNKNDVNKVKMYECKFIIDDDVTININKFNFKKFDTLLKLSLDYESSNEYVKFDISFEKEKPKYIFAHIDTSRSRDSTVVSLYYDKIIEYHVITPKYNKKISYVDLEKLVKKLNNICKVVSMDTFNSAEFEEKFNVVCHSFGREQQYNVLQHFKLNMENLTININENEYSSNYSGVRSRTCHERLIEEFSSVEINNTTKYWKSNCKGSTDIMDAIIYSYYNSKEYELEIEKSMTKKTFNHIGYNGMWW